MYKFLFAILTLGVSSDLFSQAGQLDHTFNNSGKATLHIAGYNVMTSALIIQDDGKLVVSGTGETTSNERDFVIARFNADGTIDDSFAEAGYRVIDFFGNNDFVHGMTLQPDGKILLTGTVTNAEFDRKSVVVRLHPDGSFDTAFGTNGISLSVADNEGEDARAIFYDEGKIIVVGTIKETAITDYSAVFKYNEDGSVDQSFGNNGIAIVSMPESFTSWFGGMQRDGKIIGGGFLLDEEILIMVRFTAQGVIDSTFGTNGIVQTDYGDADLKAYAMLEQPDHKILVVTGITHSGKRDFAMLRYTESGLPDSTFGTNGRVITAFSSSSNTAHAIALQEDNKILLAGFLGTTPNHDMALARYTPSGSLDIDFGTGGKVITDFGEDDLAFRMKVQPDKKIVLAGHTIDNAGNSDFAIARYLSGLETVSTRESHLDNLNISLYPNPVVREAVLNYSLSHSDRISVSLYDFSGKLIQRFMESERRSKGEHAETLVFNVTSFQGSYILVLNSKLSTISLPIILKSR